LDFFCGGIVSYSSAETRWAPMLGGIRKSGQVPRTRKRERTVNTFECSSKIEGD
jgi:hypothetical protein